MVKKLAFHRPTLSYCGRVEYTFGYIFPLKSERILEIGCSTGETTAELLDHNPSSNVVALDLNFEALAQARVRCRAYGDRVTFVRGNGYSPQQALDDRQLFGAIFMMNNLAFVANKISSFMLQCVLAEVRNSLEPSGQLFISAERSYVVLDREGNELYSFYTYDTAEARTPRSVDPYGSLKRIAQNAQFGFLTKLRLHLAGVPSFDTEDCVTA